MATADILRAAHSPLPFDASRESVFSGENCIAICDVWDAPAAVDDGNAAFIVRACNAHYQMLEALKKSQAALDFADFPEVLKVVRAAIAAAEAEAGR